MNSLVLFLALLGGDSKGLADGTLLFHENSNKFVHHYTDSKITHVALIVRRDGRPWVYEATPGRVRRIDLPSYRVEMSGVDPKKGKPMRMRAMSPKSPYQEDEIARMREYLDSQLGRRYSIRSYVRGEPGDGIHCAELAAHALARTGRIEFAACHRESPASLIDKVEPLYAEAGEVPLAESTNSDETWCDRAWKSWGSFSSWCSWACFETWTFCR